MTKKDRVIKDSIYRRFGVKFPSQEKARIDFMTVIKNILRNSLLFHKEIGEEDGFEIDNPNICFRVCNDLKIRYYSVYINSYFPSDFIDFLKFLESVYKFLPKKVKEGFEAIIIEEINNSEVDLGIRFKGDKFYPIGAKELDKALIEDVLTWVKDKSVKKALYDALEDYQEVKNEKDQRKMASVIKNSYEALEAMAKVVCNNNDDLSGNREKFIKKIEINEIYKEMLKQYIDFANRFRHPAGKSKARPKLKKHEVETFLYMSGIFIRLALEAIKPSR